VCEAAAGRLLDETHWVELKKDLPNNTDLAKGLASLAVDGGLLLAGVTDDDGRAGDVCGTNLVGLVDRVGHVARDKVRPSLIVRTHEVRDPDREGVGCLLVHVPRSTEAPHMVDHVYYGRGDRARIRLSDEQVRAIMDERARARSDIISELHRMVEDDPISAGDRRSGHLYLLTHPEFAPAEALVDFLSDRDSGRVIVQMMNGIVQDEPKDYPPSIGGLSGPSTRAEGRAFTSYHPEEGPRREEFTLEVVIREDGGVRLMCGRGTAEYRAPHTLDPPTMVVILGLVLSLARQIVTLAGQIGDQHAAYQGQWRLGILIDRLKGVLPADRLHPMSGSVGGPYSRDTYERITSATTEELTGAPGQVAERLVAPLLRGLGVANSYLADS
jgi:hypothetical protein